MAKKETTVYFCDRCKKEIPRVGRTLTFKKDISDLWKPKTWGKTHKLNFDLCDDCFSSFLEWLRVA